MTLCDTGPLVALVDQDDSAHARCVAALNILPASPLLTTWPYLVEAMYLLWRAGGLPAQEELWGYLTDGLVILHTPEFDEWKRMQELMRQYHDTPMDVADASLVVAAERRNLHRIFTIDSDFYVYRINGTQPFVVVP